MVELYAVVIGRFDGVFDSDVAMEDVVDSDSIGSVGPDVVVDFIRGVSVACSVFAHVFVLSSGVVGCFALVEVDEAVFAFPECLVFLEVFVEEAVDSDIVAVCDEAVVGGVDVPTDGVSDAMVGAPNPEVVANDVVAVDFEGCVDMGFPWDEATDAEEHVGEDDGVFDVAGSGWLVADFEEGAG